MEGLLTEDGGNLGAKSGSQRVFVNNQSFAGLSYRPEDCLVVQRVQGSEVDHFHAHAKLFLNFFRRIK